MTGESQPTRKLFGGRADDSHYNARINVFDDSWDVYAQGYRRAAELLAKEVKQQRHIDTLVYPLIYLCRHYLELQLKILIRDARKLLDKPDTAIPTGHKVDQLWAMARPLVREVFTEDDEKELVEVDDVITQFVAVDPGSTSFRYPVQLNGDTSLDGFKVINVAQFYELYEKVESLLAGASCGIHQYIGWKADMEADAMQGMMNDTRDFC